MMTGLFKRASKLGIEVVSAGWYQNREPRVTITEATFVDVLQRLEALDEPAFFARYNFDRQLETYQGHPGNIVGELDTKKWQPVYVRQNDPFWTNWKESHK